MQILAEFLTDLILGSRFHRQFFVRHMVWHNEKVAGPAKVLPGLSGRSCT